MKRNIHLLLPVLVLAAFVLTPASQAQRNSPAQNSTVTGMRAQRASQEPPRMAQPPAVVSPEVLPDRRVIFRLYAPEAGNVALRAGDIPNLGESAFTKTDDGVWEAAIGPVDPGSYRYTFTVNGVQVLDPRNTSVSESNTTVQSLLYVPGAEFMDTRNVPHGAVASVYYHSSTLGRTRRMHVYTPPGYEAGQQKYPVFYLIHGGGDNDDAWTSVGRAGFIMDNLIAAGKAKPMVIVMPHGHTTTERVPPTPTRPPGATDEVVNDFLKDIVPYVDKNYRVLTDRSSRAIAGLSQGGGQTLIISIPNLEMFGYIGVFSSGLYQVNVPEWEKEHLRELDNDAWKKGLKLFWFATGSDDFIMDSTQETMALLKKHGYELVYKETGGGHTWINWRNYLNEFAPQLFQ